MKGATDEEMAEAFGISVRVLWVRTLPTLGKLAEVLLEDAEDDLHSRRHVLNVVGSRGRFLSVQPCLGNHRVQAAISAGLETIPCIITDDEMSEEQRIAIQLSHNAIVGQDDPDVLKKLYDKILDIDLKEYSGLDDKTLGLLDKASSQAMSEANLEFQVLSIVYLPAETPHAA